MAATYGGTAIFGYSVTMVHDLTPPAEQLNAYFGLNGVQSLFGGGRGRSFRIEGVFFGQDLNTLNAVEGIYASFVDGIARTLVDTRGRAFGSVLLKPHQPGGRVLQDVQGFWLPYRGLAIGLI